ncbi:hypothetical protein LSAT2_016414, partial [Lamellibrachia satsuma]
MLKQQDTRLDDHGQQLQEMKTLLEKMTEGVGKSVDRPVTVEHPPCKWVSKSIRWKEKLQKLQRLCREHPEKLVQEIRGQICMCTLEKEDLEEKEDFLIAQGLDTARILARWQCVFCTHVAGEVFKAMVLGTMKRRGHTKHEPQEPKRFLGYSFEKFTHKTSWTVGGKTSVSDDEDIHSGGSGLTKLQVTQIKTERREETEGEREAEEMKAEVEAERDDDRMIWTNGEEPTTEQEKEQESATELCQRWTPI